MADTSTTDSHDPDHALEADRSTGVDDAGASMRRRRDAKGRAANDPSSPSASPVPGPRHVALGKPDGEATPDAGTGPTSPN